MRRYVAAAVVAARGGRAHEGARVVGAGGRPALEDLHPAVPPRAPARGRRRRVVVVGVAAAAREGVEHVVAAGARGQG